MFSELLRKITDKSEEHDQVIWVAHHAVVELVVVEPIDWFAFKKSRLNI